MSLHENLLIRSFALIFAAIPALELPAQPAEPLPPEPGEMAPFEAARERAEAVGVGFEVGEEGTEVWTEHEDVWILLGSPDSEGGALIRLPAGERRRLRPDVPAQVFRHVFSVAGECRYGKCPTAEPIPPVGFREPLSESPSASRPSATVQHCEACPEGVCGDGSNSCYDACCVYSTATTP